MTDPFLDDSYTSKIKSSDITACHHIFITHGHFDHVMDVGKIAKRHGAKVYCSSTVSKSLQRHLEVPSSLIEEVEVGRTLKIDDLEVEVLRGLHPDLGQYYESQTGQKIDPLWTPKELAERLLSLWVPQRELVVKYAEAMVHFPSGEQLNYLFHLDGNMRLYLLSSVPDASLWPEVERVRAQVLLLQIIQGYEEASARLALHSNCSLVIPQHHDRLFPKFPQADLGKVEKALKAEPCPRFMPLEIGKWYELGLEVRPWKAT